MRQRPPRATPLYSAAASDVYKRQGVPFDRFEGLAIVLPVRVNHAQGAVLNPVADKILDIGNGHAEIRQNTVPIAHAGTNEELVSRSGEWDDLAFEAGAGVVAPSEHDGI